MKAFKCKIISSIILVTTNLFTCQAPAKKEAAASSPKNPQAQLIPSEKFIFNSFVDCNMATVWVADTFRIFPGKYGEDPLWGNARELKYASGATVDDVFSRPASQFTEPKMPVNAPAGQPGLHGAVWFETLYKDPRDKTDKTLFALYHNENYPATLPYNASTGEGYRDVDWP